MSQENIFRMSQSRNSSNFNQSRYSVEDGRKSKLINLSQDFLDDVFEDNNVSQGSKKPRSSQGSVSSVNTEVSKSEYDVSSDTCMRLEELDNKVQTLWQKLSTKDEDYEKFVSNTQVCISDSFTKDYLLLFQSQFTCSVSKIKNDVKESIEHQSRFMNQVRVAKQLFNSPTPVKHK